MANDQVERLKQQMIADGVPDCEIRRIERAIRVRQMAGTSLILRVCGGCGRTLDGPDLDKVGAVFCEDATGSRWMCLDCSEMDADYQELGVPSPAETGAERARARAMDDWTVNRNAQTLEYDPWADR